MIMFPGPAKNLNDLLQRKNSERYIPLKKFFPYCLTRHREPDLEWTTVIETGDELKGGFKGFLSNNGITRHLVRCNGERVDFDYLEGKHLIICCFSLPMSTSEAEADTCRALIDSYPELTQLGVEIVLVVEAEPNDVKLFDHFFAAFPCLAIPFFDYDTRHSICSSIGLDTAIVVNPLGIVLQHLDTLSYFKQLGSDWYPFQPNTWYENELKDNELRSRLDPVHAFSCDPSQPWPSTKGKPLSLYEDILLCDPSHLLLRCDPSVGSSTVLDLTHKYVGLYLCIDGNFMEKLKEAHDHCIENKLELEIVVVCVSLFDDPKSYKEDLLEALKLCNIRSWFLFESDSKVCRKIYRIFGHAGTWPGDRFIIIPPNSVCGELEGKEVITTLGIKEYPFTRSVILKRKVDALRSVSIPSILLNKDVCKSHTSLLPTIPSLLNKGVSNSLTSLLLTIPSLFNKGASDSLTSLLLTIPSLFSKGASDSLASLLLTIPSLFNKSSSNSPHCLVRKGKKVELQLQSKKLLLYLDWLERNVDRYRHYRLLVEYYSAIQAKGWEVVFVPLNVEDVHPDCLETLDEMPWPYMPLSDAIKARVADQLTFSGERYDHLIAVGEDGMIRSRDVHKQLMYDGVTDSLFDDALYRHTTHNLFRVATLQGNYCC